MDIKEGIVPRASSLLKDVAPALAKAGASEMAASALATASELDILAEKARKLLAGAQELRTTETGRFLESKLRGIIHNPGPRKPLPPRNQR